MFYICLFLNIDAELVKLYFESYNITYVLDPWNQVAMRDATRHVYHGIIACCLV